MYVANAYAIYMWKFVHGFEQFTKLFTFLFFRKDHLKFKYTGLGLYRDSVNKREVFMTGGSGVVAIDNGGALLKASFGSHEGQLPLSPTVSLLVRGVCW
jgi:hypothetical protein